MVNRLLVLLLLAASLISGVEEAPPAAPDQTLLVRLADANRAVRSLSGRIVQRTIRIDDVVDGSDLSQGDPHDVVFALELPNSYDVVYTKPRWEGWRSRRCCDGSVRVELDQMDAEQEPDVTRSHVNTPAAGVPCDDPAQLLIDLLCFDPVVINREFIAAIDSVGDGYRLVLRPRPGAMADQIAAISIDLDAEFHPSEIRQDDRQGNRMVFRIVELVYNPTLPPERFRYGPAD